MHIRACNLQFSCIMSCFFLCPLHHPSNSILFFFNDTATTEIYTLSLHDALPISARLLPDVLALEQCRRADIAGPDDATNRSEEHTSELQSRLHLVCRLLLEKKKKKEKSKVKSL